VAGEVELGPLGAHHRQLDRAERDMRTAGPPRTTSAGRTAWISLRSVGGHLPAVLVDIRGEEVEYGHVDDDEEEEVDGGELLLQVHGCSRSIASDSGVMNVMYTMSSSIVPYHTTTNTSSTRRRNKPPVEDCLAKAGLLLLRTGAASSLAASTASNAAARLASSLTRADYSRATDHLPDIGPGAYPTDAEL
jgi:hypothetical protein